MSTRRTAKEVVYGEQINPLIGQIVDLCQQHGICCSIGFDISGPEAKGLIVSTQNPDGEGMFSPGLKYVRVPEDQLKANDRPNPGSVLGIAEIRDSEEP